MALAIDASTPLLAAGSNDPWVTATFTPPAGSLMVAVVTADWFGGTPTLTVQDDGLASVFTSRIKAGADSQGVVEIFTAPTIGGGTSRTCTGTTSLASDVGGLKIYVLTGQHTSTPVDTTGSNTGDTTNNLTVNALTTGFDGCWVLGGAVDWQSLGAPTSTDVFENFDDADLSVICARKAAATSPAGAVTLNFDAGVGTPMWTWAAISIRPDAAPPPAPLLPGIARSGLILGPN